MSKDATPSKSDELSDFKTHNPMGISTIYSKLDVDSSVLDFYTLFIYLIGAFKTNKQTFQRKSIE